MTINELYDIYLQHPQVQTDTRKLQPGDLFFALKGANFNGNEFALQALQAGAAYAIVDEEIDANNKQLLQVPDVLTALQQLAKYHREQLDIPFIAITGSNGKTTTKELVHAVLSSHYKTYTTKGNLNNHIGIPLTLLQVKRDAQMAVVEMGANHLQEIAGYCQYTLPTHGIITNCGKAHLEGFGSAEGVRKGKGELYDFIRANGGSIFAFDDYDYLHSMSAGIEKIYWYGTQNGNIVGHAGKHDAFLSVTFTKGVSFAELQTQLVGTYNLPNVLCAVAIGKYFGVPEEKIKHAVESYLPSNSRSQLIMLGSNTVILDAYNANPSSMKAAIENFAVMPGDNKVMLLGGMAELGNDSEREHQQLVALIDQYPFKSVVLVGKYFNNIPHHYIHLPDAEAAKEWLLQQQLAHATILVKGSRAMQMEKVIS
ncbi:UDP-N-acetylmuramoyl-tripeptide--D-alanyl-D-alanine ligase [Ilyomonas limi]|uniref:UDP-N-acetylmuramoyl-tripeptide--D-alanyl-D-alanine ligase n=1 Tax=Ilyomonas limi TaxID=2575867 RepID=A0A4U3L6C2_9BACT|nr:UDP-N-acetylmuramoyl-tripeptide--D-alanyl-D-alanine ligase [Ilyomonas limi]